MVNFSFRSTITDEDIRQLPKVTFDGDIVLVEDFGGQNDAAHYLSQYEVIGVDTESRASFQKGVVNKISLLQLSAGDKAFLIRLNRVKLAKSIIDILESEKHYKIGVALHDDIKEMRGVSPFEPKGFIDLQKIIKDYGIEELSLKKMVAIVLESQISKAQRLSNWEATNLTDSQCEYAATDAWVCEQIFNKLDIISRLDILKKGDVTPTYKKKKRVNKEIVCEVKPEEDLTKNIVEDSLDKKKAKRKKRNWKRRITSKKVKD